jgi:hypothetical protein
MPLQKQTVMLNLAAPANQKTDPKSLTPGTPTIVENAQFVKGNRIDKRFGYDNINIALPNEPTLYRNFAFYAPDDLDSSFRIQVTSGGFIRLQFTVPRSVGYAGFISELETYLNTPGGTLHFYDELGNEWLFTYLVNITFIGQDLGSDYSRIDILIFDGAVDTVTVLWNGAPILVNDVINVFNNYSASDSATYASNNPNGLERIVAPSTPLTDIKGIIGTEEHLLIHAGDFAYDYNKVKDEVIKVGMHLPAETIISSIDETGKPLISTDSIYLAADDITYYAFCEVIQTGGSGVVHSGAGWVMAVCESGDVVFRPIRFDAQEDLSVRMIKFDNRAYVVYSYTNNALNNFTIKAFEVTKTGMGSVITLATDGGGGDEKSLARNNFFVENWKDTRLILTYSNPARSILVRYFNYSLVELTAPYDVLVTPTGLGIGRINQIYLGVVGTDDAFQVATVFRTIADTDSGWIQVNEDGTLRHGLQIFNVPSAGGFEIPGFTRGITMYGADTGCYVLANMNGDQYPRGYGVRTFFTQPNVVATPVSHNLYDVRIISRHIVYNGNRYHVYYRSAPNDTGYFLGTRTAVNAEPALSENIYVVTRILFGRAPDEDSDYEPLMVNVNINEISEGVFRFSLVTRDSVTQVPGSVSALVDFNSKELFTGEPYGNSVLVAGTNLHSYGGQYLRELGFFYSPRAPVLTAVASGGYVQDGKCRVLCVYEFTDKNGYLHRTAPGPSTEVQSAGGNTSTIEMVINTYLNGNIDAEGLNLTKIIPYRTLAGGSIFYREDYVDQWDLLPDQKAKPFVHDNLDFETTTIDLIKSDEALESSAVLYTDGGEVPPSPMPPIKYLSTWGSRIWGGGSPRDEAIFFSKINQTNLIPEFSEALNITIQDKPGRTTGIQGFTDKIVLSKRGRLFYSYGQGPNNLGGAGSFALFEEIMGVSGAINGKSMVVNGAGLHYKSDKGIYTLGPGLNTVFSGAMFEDSADEDILKAITPIDSETIRFLTASGIISHNNYFGSWSLDSSTELLPKDAVIHDNEFYVLTTDDKVMIETKDSYVDNSAEYDMSLETGWISTAGLVGFQRFYKLMMVMDNKSPYSVTVSLAYDYGAYEDSVSFVDSVDARIIIYPRKQKCEAFRLKIEVTPTTGNQNSLNINFIGIVVGSKKGLPKQLPVSQRIGTSTI